MKITQDDLNLLKTASLMMTNAQLATASLDDIVFDGRNRHYGAYELRALYQRHMTRALIIATALWPC